jgi:hypothetical protein
VNATSTFIAQFGQEDSQQTMRITNNKFAIEIVHERNTAQRKTRNLDTDQPKSVGIPEKHCEEAGPEAPSHKQSCKP